MAYGLECWDANGNKILDSNERYSRLIYSGTHGSSSSVDLPDLEGHDSVQWAEPLEGYYTPNVTRDGTTIEWNVSDFGETDYDFMILVFMYT